jgi:hypothetical protein
VDVVILNLAIEAVLHAATEGRTVSTLVIGPMPMPRRQPGRDLGQDSAVLRTPQYSIYTYSAYSNSFQPAFFESFELLSPFAMSV